MKLTDANSKEDIQQALLEADVYIDQEDSERRSRIKASIVSWGVSLMMHLTVFIFAVNLVFFVNTDLDIETPPVKISYIQPTPPVEKDKKFIDRSLTKMDVILETDTVNENTVENPITIMEAVDDKTLNEAEDLTNDLKKGREEAKGDLEMGSTGLATFIGVGGGGSGMFGNRSGLGKQRTKGKMGPMGRPAEAAQEAGLRWLQRHQSPDGKWSAERYFMNCTIGNKCEPGKLASGEADIAMTGYALLCFAGAGYDHNTPNKYRKVVRKGLDYLLSVQKPDGSLGNRNYENPVAAMAICELYGVANDPSLRDPAQKAINSILARQSTIKGDDYSRVGWDYVSPNAKRNDLSVTGWNVMALKSAYAAGLNVGKGIEGSKNMLEGAWKAANPNWEKLTNPYTDKSIFPYTWNAIDNKTERDHLSFVGATCAVFLGCHSGNIMFESMLNDANARWIDSGAYKNNTYASYYLSMADFQAGGDRWQKVLDTIIPYAISQQVRSEDCFDGSWGYQGQSWHGADTSRVLSTCYNILNMEVAYRYVQVNPGAIKALNGKKAP